MLEAMIIKATNENLELSILSIYLQDLAKKQGPNFNEMRLITEQIKKNRRDISENMGFISWLKSRQEAIKNGPVKGKAPRKPPERQKK